MLWPGWFGSPNADRAWLAIGATNDGVVLPVGAALGRGCGVRVGAGCGAAGCGFAGMAIGSG
jgi:hypothetical protein